MGPGYPIVTVPEKLYRFQLKPINMGGVMISSGDIDLTILNAAHGESLSSMIKPKGASARLGMGELLKIMFSVGRALGLLNLHFAGLRPGAPFALLNPRLKFIHEDLHMSNIMIARRPGSRSLHGEPIDHSYKVWLIDTESFATPEADSWYRNRRTGDVDRVKGQFERLYGMAMFGHDNFGGYDVREIKTLVVDGLITGYATVFEHPQPAVRELIEAVLSVNELYLEIQDGGTPGATPAEEHLYFFMKKHHKKDVQEGPNRGDFLQKVIALNQLLQESLRQRTLLHHGGSTPP